MKKEVTLDIAVRYVNENGVVCRDTFEYEVSERRAKSLIANAHRSLAGMSPKDECYRIRLDMEKELEYRMKNLDCQFKKIDSIKESE